jgi:DhnA family fructose-bisphosphate aldolase class Ia
VRLGEELGADAIKTVNVPDKDLMSAVVKSTSKPVFVAGGPKISKEHALHAAEVALQAGVAGVSFGRNVFGRSDPGSMITALKALSARYRQTSHQGSSDFKDV